MRLTIPKILNYDRKKKKKLKFQKRHIVTMILTPTTFNGTEAFAEDYDEKGSG